MFFKFISYLRKKPKHVRDLIALGLSISITLAIGIFWVMSYTQYINKKMNSESAVSFSSIYNKIKTEATSQDKPSTDISTSSDLVISEEASSTEDIATSSDDISVKATTSSEDLIQ